MSGEDPRDAEILRLQKELHRAMQWLWLIASQAGGTIGLDYQEIPPDWTLSRDDRGDGITVAFHAGRGDPPRAS